MPRAHRAALDIAEAVDQLERALRFESIDSVELRLEKLQSEKQTRS